MKTRGQFVVKRQRPRYRTTADARQIIVPYVGPFADLVAKEPPIDSAISGFPSNFKVKEVVIEEGRAHDGRMVVTLELPNPGSTGSTENQQIGEPIYELDWGEQVRPIEQHPEMPILKEDRKVYEFPEKVYDEDSNSGWAPGTKAPNGKTGRQRTWEDWVALDDDDLSGGTWNLETYKALKRQGMDTYSVPFPIARATVYAKYRIPPNGAVNTVSSPPAECGAPNDWTYVKISSRPTKQGRLYTLVEEWRGYPGSGWNTVFG
jgi:hypothetical protein